MWFLIKGSVWFALVLVVLSYFGTQPQSETVAPSALEMTDAVTAATQAYQYLSAICIEKPDVCEKGAETFSALGLRAREGARVAFELLDKQFADEAPVLAEAAEPQPMPQKPLAADAISTGAIATVPLPQKRPDTR